VEDAVFRDARPCNTVEMLPAFRGNIQPLSSGRVFLRNAARHVISHEQEVLPRYRVTVTIAYSVCCGNKGFQNILVIVYVVTIELPLFTGL
jgi:hypothetical protein